MDVLPTTRIFPAALVVLTLLSARDGDVSADAHTARIESDQIHAIVADHEAYGADHREGYSGVAELRVGPGNQKNLFVPKYAGLNFEHIFSGDAASFGWSVFEPRLSPMQLIRQSETGVELLQERTEHWPLHSRLTYQAKDDGIDLTYIGTPTADAWSKHGYIGLFFGSYIDAPEDMAIQFIGRSRPGRGDTRTRWIKHLPEKDGVAANHRPSGSTWDPPLDEGFGIDLVKGTSDLEYLYPFYFGRSGENVFVMMFEQTNDEGELRFAQSPSGGGKDNPAWDFVYLRRAYEVGRPFSFRVRAIYRKFTSAEDVVRTYEKWSGAKVERP